MNINTISLHIDSYKDLNLIFIDEVRIEETEKRFASYLKEYLGIRGMFFVRQKRIPNIIA